MPNWKKIITSGSDATLNSLYVTSSIGIGVQSPLYNLDVSGSANIALDNIPGPYLTNKFSVRNGILRLGVDANLTYGSRFIQFTDAEDTTEYFSFNTNLDGNPQFSMGNRTSFSINSGPANYGLGDPLVTFLSTGKVGIGNTNPKVRLQVGDGGGGMQFPYEEMVIERNGDAKFGVYTSLANPGISNGASYVLGATNFLTNTNQYPGYEFQFIANSQNQDNYIRYNYILRNINGTVSSATINLFNIYADGRVILNGSDSGTGIANVSPKLGIGTTSPSYSLDVSGTGRFTNNLIITGSVKISDVLVLPYQHPLPSSKPIGSIALSGSGATFNGMYMYNGTSWIKLSV